MNRNVTIVVIILVLVVLAGYLVWVRSRLTPATPDQLVVTPTPTIEMSPTPSASPSATPSATPKAGSKSATSGAMVK